MREQDRATLNGMSATAAPQLLLAGTDLTADNRLDVGEPFHRPAEVQVLGCRGEAAEFAQVELARIEINALKVSIVGKGIGRRGWSAPRLDA